MVYESDYTTRRVYSGTRPGISTSYSISQPTSQRWSLYDDESEDPYFEEMAFLPQTLPYQELPAAMLRRPDLFVTYAPGFAKGRKHHRVIVQTPRIVHQRLMPVSAPPRRHRNTNVYDALEFGRSGNQYVLVNYRPTPPPVPRSRVMYIEDVTNNNFDEYNKERRDLQRDMDNMYMRVALGVPLHPTRSLYNMHHIPMRSASEVKEVADLRRLHVRANNPMEHWSPLNKPNIYRMPLIYKADPATLAPSHYYIGRGNLACLSFAGGRPIPKRRRFYPGYEDKVLDDVTFRSFYMKVRNAANIAAAARGRTPLYQPIHYSRKTIMGGNPEPRREITESKWVQRAMANEKEPPERKNKEAPVVKRDSIKEVAGARRESLTKEPKPELPQSGRPINVTLPGPRKSVTEIIREELPKVENLPEQSITVRRPSTLKETVESPPEHLKAEETVVLPKAVSKPKEPTPPPKEPTPPPREPTPPTREPTPPPKEPTPPPKEPTPPPKEPTPPPREPTPPPPPPPKEATPPPPEPEPVPVAAAPAEEASVASEAASASSAAPGNEAASDEGSNKGEVEDIPLEEEVTLDEVCEVQVEESDLEIEDEDEPAENMAVEEQEPVAAMEVESGEAQEAVDAQEDNVVLDEETPSGVSIHVADIDGPVEVDPDQRNGEQEPMTVEQIQAEAERRRTEFARLLEEHHDIVAKVDRLEHLDDTEHKTTLETVVEVPTPIPTPTPDETLQQVPLPNDTELPPPPEIEKQEPEESTVVNNSDVAAEEESKNTEEISNSNVN